MAKQRYTVAQIKEALIANSGFQIHAATELGCDRSTVENYILRYPELQEVLRNEVEKQKDHAELQLQHAIKDREPWAITLFLKTRAKDRGYVERVEQTGRDGGPIKEELTGKDGGPIELMPIRDRISARLDEMLRRQEAQHAIPSSTPVSGTNGHTAEDLE